MVAFEARVETGVRSTRWRSAMATARTAIERSSPIARTGVLAAGAVAAAAVTLYSVDASADPTLFSFNVSADDRVRIVTAVHTAMYAAKLYATYFLSDIISDAALFRGLKLDHGPLLNGIEGKPTDTKFMDSRAQHWTFVAGGLVLLQIPLERVFGKLQGGFDFVNGQWPAAQLNFWSFNFSFIAAGVIVGLIPVSWAAGKYHRAAAFVENVKLTLIGTASAFAFEPVINLATYQLGLQSLPGGHWVFGMLLPATVAYYLVKRAWGAGVPALSPFCRRLNGIA